MRLQRTFSLLALGGVACAHGPAVQGEADREATTRMALVTGSRVPQPVDARTGRPEPTPGLRIYDRDAFATSGRVTWGDALHDLEPADSGSASPSSMPAR